MKKIKYTSILILLICVNIQTCLASINESTNDYLMLLNENYVVSQKYSPQNTINIAKYVPCTNSKMIMEAQAGKAFVELYKDLANAGITDLKVCSAYRSYNTQKYIFNNKINEYISDGYSEKDSYNIAKSIVAIPSTSEHQTGLAVDVTIYGNLEPTFENTEASKWLRQNSYKYGFILSFPNEKQDITGIIYEPWHYRYVGKTHAKIMYENNWCLPEYINYLKKNKMTEMFIDDNVVRIYYGDNSYEGEIIEVSNTNTEFSITTTIEKFDPYKYVYSNWAEKDIINYFELTSKRPSTYLYPNINISRGMFISLLDSVVDKPKEYTYNGFNDVEESNEYYSSIKSAYEKGILVGDGKYFNPNDSINREQMAVMVSRVLNLSELKLLEFNDISNISGWAFQDMQKLFCIGYLQGYEDNTIRPKDSVNLSEAISLLIKCFPLSSNQNHN